MPIVEGAGTAGTPAARVLTVQGIAGATNLPIQLTNSSGTEIGTATTPVRVDPTGTTAQPITDNAGSITVDAPVGTPVRVDPTGTTAQPIAGDVAHDAADSGNPVKIGVRTVASATDITATGAADRANAIGDLLGRQIVSDAPATWTVSTVGTANTALTLTQALVTGRRHVVTHVDVYIWGAAAVSDIDCILRDGVTGTGTVKWQGVIGAGAPRGDSAGIAFPHGIEMTAGNAVNLDVDAGGASVVAIANMGGYTS